MISTKETTYGTLVMRKWTLKTREKKRLLEAPLGLKNQGILQLIIEGSRTSEL